ncbi:MAG: hypothetical protein ACRCUY_06595, partial [Thermoguttaceae bacterium]
MFACFLLSLPFVESMNAEALKIERDRLLDIVDDSPLARSADKSGWDYLFSVLREQDDSALEREKALSVGFTELQRQPVEYRGRLVKIEGRLVRCEFFPVAHSETIFSHPTIFSQQLQEESTTKKTQNDDSNLDESDRTVLSSEKKKNGYYRAWILVKDKENVPICVCFLDLPKENGTNGFPLGDNLNESVSVTGIFYKRLLFLSSDGEEVTTPTILAKTIHWISVRKSTKTPEKLGDVRHSKTDWSLGIAISIIILVWFITRFWGRKLFASMIFFTFGIIFLLSESSAIFAALNEMVIQSETAVIPETAAQNFSTKTTRISAQKVDSTSPSTLIDSELTKMLLNQNDLEWETLGEPIISIEQQRES